MSYLENFVLDITDLDFLVGASIWSRGGQQRLESKGQQKSSSKSKLLKKKENKTTVCK